jgi:hypothetical protein
MKHDVPHQPIIDPGLHVRAVGKLREEDVQSFWGTLHVEKIGLYGCRKKTKGKANGTQKRESYLYRRLDAYPILTKLLYSYIDMLQVTIQIFFSLKLVFSCVFA